MTSKAKILLLRAINVFLFAVLIFIQYSDVFSIKIVHAFPVLPMAFLICTCMFSSELTATLTGLLVGMFMDVFSSAFPGFNSILLLITGLTVSLAVKHLFNNNVFSAAALCAAYTFIYLLLKWVICIVFSASLNENLTYLMQNIFPSVLYTTIFSVPFYFFERMLHNKIHK